MNNAGISATEPQTLLGEAVSQIEPCPSGFSHSTSVVTLATSRRVIYQRLRQPQRAAMLVRLTAELPAYLAEAGIRAPVLLASDLQSTPPIVVREYLDGVAANTLLNSPETAQTLAQQMGALIPKLAQVRAPAWLDQTWGDPYALQQAARTWLDRSAKVLASQDHAQLSTDLHTLPEHWIAGRQFAHGDFCPVNALVEDDQVTALIDLECARVAGPYFDAAWWGWVMRYHHPEHWEQIWPLFLRAAKLTNNPTTMRHVQLLQRLQCLELLDQALETTGPAAQHWADRVAKTLRWPC